MVGAFLVICLIVMLVRRPARSHLAWVGGKIGRRRPTPAGVDLPSGFSGVTSRDITVWGAQSDGKAYSSIQDFLRNCAFKRTELARFYRIAGCKTRIEIPARRPDYERITATETLALVRELPDPRLILRLHLSDEPSFYDAWLHQQDLAPNLGHLGHATTSRLVVLYRPDRGQLPQLRMTLLHEWLHLVAFRSGMALRRFKSANAIEPPASFPMAPLVDQRLQHHEVWAELGERVVGPDDAMACEAALAAPVHSMILWRRVEGLFRSVPTNLATTRRAELEARAAFMTSEVAPKARALARWWM